MSDKEPGQSSGKGKARATAASWYGVRVGAPPGVYESWKECRAAVDRVRGAVYKRFGTRDEALAFAALDAVALAALDAVDDDSADPLAFEMSRFSPERLLENLRAPPPGPPAQEQKETTSCNTHVWVAGDASDPDSPKIGCFFGVEGSSDSRDYVGPYLAAPPCEPTRLVLAACIRALSILGRQDRTMHRRSVCNDVVVLHTSDRFVCGAIQRWLRSWTRKGWRGDTVRHRDLYELLARQIRPRGDSRRSVCCVLESPNEPRMRQAVEALVAARSPIPRSAALSSDSVDQQ